MLESIVVSGFRNIEGAELALGSGFNLVLGANGAGKTSLLEAVYCLGRARSFIPGRLDELTRRGASGWWVRGRLATASRSLVLGVGRLDGRTQVRLDGESVARLSEVAWLLPVQVLNTRSQRLLTDGPSERRAFLNWGAFHVEHGFADAWRRYGRALHQRNAALRGGDSRLAAAWEPEMAAAGSRVDGLRAAFLESLWPYWRQQVARWLGGLSVSWSYRRGWDRDTEFGAQLASKRARELELGYSLSGPQRADLRFTVDGRDAGSELSRGQQKLLVTALRFALVELLGERQSAGRPLLLMDDLPSELDRENQRAVVEAATALGAQVVVTAIERDDLATGAIQPDAMFHVEQGVYRELL